jgi:hypothetical protein
MIAKRFFVCGFVLISFVILRAQTTTGIITGRVLDSQTLEPLPFANVYINFTTIGTSANGNGDFVLTGVPLGTHELIASQVGHKSYQTKVQMKGADEVRLIIKLVGEVLKEVEVKSKRDVKWEGQLAKFRKLFFGNSPHAEFCKINNPWVLDFAENGTGNFVASASIPLDIENLSLGYRILYQLKKFEVRPDSYTIGGNVRFQKIPTDDVNVLSAWQKRRMSAYEGSYRHLFRSLIENKVQANGFELYEDRSGSAEVVRSANFLANINKTLFAFSAEGKVDTATQQGQFIISLPERLEVHYLNRTAHNRVYTNQAHPISWMEVKGGEIEVNELGMMMNPAQLVVSGAMSESRIAEILPNDYVPPATIATQQQKKRPVSALSYLMEKPYLQTDRSYYYPHEVIWFEGYMNYFAPAMKDSLSKVLHVDLVDAAQKIVATKLFPVLNGRVTGSFPFPRILPKGDYELRAYTRWMLNFDESFIFRKPIKIIDYGEVVQGKNFQIDEKNNQGITITSFKDEFEPRERVTLDIESKDFYGYARAANLSVSVTDLHGAMPGGNEKIILSSFAIPASALPDTTLKNTPHLIQYGIELKGKFEDLKKRPVKALITFYRDNSDEMINVITQDDGSFFLMNQELYDSISLYAQGQTEKGKRQGLIYLDSVSDSPDVKVIDPLKIEIRKEEYGTADKRSQMPDQLPYHLLENVTIKGTKTEDYRSERSASVIHGKADFTIDEADIRKGLESGDILMFLQSKIPGMKVSLPDRQIILAGPTSISSVNPEPLVLLDGMPLNPANGTMGEQISNLNPSSIKRIEFIKYSGASSYGARGGTGVIAIYTRLGNGESKIAKFDKTKFQLLKVKGLEGQRNFKSPDYSKQNNEVTGDYRTTIYWNPNLVTDGLKPTQISFYAADLPTQYRIVIEGVDVDGKPLRGEKIIVIKDKSFKESAQDSLKK